VSASTATPVVPYGARDKHAAVRAMFGRIAPRYDLVNRVMTGGLDGLWRRLAATEAVLPPGGLALDVGTGTGDLAFALARSAPGARAIGADYTGEMLARAPIKARAAGLAERTAFLRGDGHRLPFPDDAFDAVASAFVLRNLADLGVAFAEMARVTRPGGRVVALEISPVDGTPWGAAFNAYFRHVVPRLGALLAGDAGAYRYLPASAAAFLAPEGVAERLRAAGLEPLPARRLMGGTLAIHRALKPG
jgi:demethylmenaquinone methyltransferase/2-methoxy-6-polyprenyl-1,4-benzoquinol methylase